MLPAVKDLKPAIDAHNIAVYNADCRKVLAGLGPGTISSIITDPPYELNLESDHRVTSWDSTRIAFDVDMWKDCLRVLKPGGHAIVFGSPRTWHRMAVAIEDAGFEIRGTLAWLYGTGFSRSSQDLQASIAEVNPAGAEQWKGWAMSIKPAFEPVILARRPMPSKVPMAYNLLINGTGALNIEECRTQSGRHPTNALVDESMAAELDLQSGPRERKQAESPEDEPGSRRTRNGREDYADDHLGVSKHFTLVKYQPKAPPRERAKIDGVSHPTIKPLDLIKWCTRLVTPPAGVVLDPFAGSGTTAQACLENGFSCITSEAESDYIPLIQHRINEVIRTWPESIADVHDLDPAN